MVNIHWYIYTFIPLLTTNPHINSPHSQPLSPPLSPDPAFSQYYHKHYHSILKYSIIFVLLLHILQNLWITKIYYILY